MTISEFDEATTTAEIGNLGARFDPEVLAVTRELYRAANKALPWAQREGIYDFAYGPHERQRIDVYPADEPGAPVLLFVHGGGFIGGDKRADDCFFGNVGRYFAAHGYLAILPSYRLAPSSTWPSGNEDMEGIMAWVKANAREHGGDPDRIFLLGQSAGAAHAAGYLFDPRVDRRYAGAIRAAALLSGFYQPKEPLLAGPRLYVGDDPTQWADRSPANHVSPSHPPLLLTVAQWDPSQIAEQTLLMASALNAVDGAPPRLIWLEGHNHVSTVHGLGVGSDVLGVALRRFAEPYLRSESQQVG